MEKTHDVDKAHDQLAPADCEQTWAMVLSQSGVGDSAPKSTMWYVVQSSDIDVVRMNCCVFCSILISQCCVCVRSS